MLEKERLKYLSVELDQRGIFTVTLNRPEVRNAFHGGMVEELHELFLRKTLQHDVRMVVLKGAGSIFCAGADLQWLQQSMGVTEEQNFKEAKQLVHLFQTLNEYPRPVIAAVHGAVLGGGVGLMSVADIVIAQSTTQFSLSEAKLGLVPACVGPFVIAKVGPSQARRLLMTAERFDALEAQKMGLVHRLVEAGASLEDKVEQEIERLMECSPQALTVCKRLILDFSVHERRHRVPDILDYAAKTLTNIRLSPEGQEGMRAFLEKRSPNWCIQEGGPGFV